MGFMILFHGISDVLPQVEYQTWDIIGILSWGYTGISWDKNPLVPSVPVASSEILAISSWEIMSPDGMFHCYLADRRVSCSGDFEDDFGGFVENEIYTCLLMFVKIFLVDCEKK